MTFCQRGSANPTENSTLHHSSSDPVSHTVRDAHFCLAGAQQSRSLLCWAVTKKEGLALLLLLLVFFLHFTDMYTTPSLFSFLATHAKSKTRTIPIPLVIILTHDTRCASEKVSVVKKVTLRHPEFQDSHKSPRDLRGPPFHRVRRSHIYSGKANVLSRPSCLLLKLLLPACLTPGSMPLLPRMRRHNTASCQSLRLLIQVTTHDLTFHQALCFVRPGFQYGDGHSSALGTEPSLAPSSFLFLFAA